MVVYAITLASPLILLGLAMLMEQVERPLRRDAVEEQLAMFLDSAQPEEVEAMVSEGFATALDRYWARRSPRRSDSAELPETSVARSATGPSSVGAAQWAGAAGPAGAVAARHGTGTS